MTLKGKSLPNIIFPTVLYFIWRLLILLFQVFLQPYLVTLQSQTIQQRIFTAWVKNWDSGHYLAISQSGYQYPQQAFFPAWPLLIKLFSFDGLSGQVNLFVLSFILGLSVFILFYILAKRLIGPDNAKYALILFCAFPSTMFLIAGYTEGLYLSLAMLSYILLEKKRFLLSGAMGGLASLTRVVGVGIAISQLLLEKPVDKKIIYFVLSLSGMVLYMIYLQITYSDPFFFIKAQHYWCEAALHCQITFPLKPITDYAELILVGWVRPALSTVFIDWTTTVVFLIMLIPVFKKLGRIYFLYSAFVLLSPLLSGSTTSMVRYVLAAFPVFFLFPLVIKPRLALILLVILMFILQLRFIALFTAGFWVA